MPGATFSVRVATSTNVLTLPDGTAITCQTHLDPDKKRFVEPCVARTKAGEQISQRLVHDRTK